MKNLSDESATSSAIVFVNFAESFRNQTLAYPAFQRQAGLRLTCNFLCFSAS